MSTSSVRSRALPLILGLLTITSIGMAAATLDTAEPVGSSGDSTIITPPDPQDFDPGDPQQNPGNAEGGGVSGGGGIDLQLSYCIDFLASSLGTSLVVVGFLGIVAGLFYRYNFATALLGGWTILPPILLVYFLLTNCDTGGGSNRGEGGPGVPNVGESPISGVEVPPWAMGVVVGGVLIGAVAMLYYSANSEEVVRPEAEDEEDEGPGLDAFAAAAGRAADRIEKHNAAVDNAVYRAWLEMTDLLDVENRDTYSPTEFAEEAIGLGMSEEDVSELTTLFNEVRYAGRDAGAREDRAVSVLRNIESEYGAEASIDEVADDAAADETTSDDTDESDT